MKHLQSAYFSNRVKLGLLVIYSSTMDRRISEIIRGVTEQVVALVNVRLDLPTPILLARRPGMMGGLSSYSL